MFDKGLKLYYRAREAFLLGDCQSATFLLSESLRAADHFKTHELLGECLEKLGEPGAALHEYESALNLNPRSNRTGVLYAQQLIRAGSVDQAIAVVRAILERCPTYGPAKALLKSVDASWHGDEGTS